jgi:hypothetical protein
MWEIKNLIESAQSTSTLVDGRFVPARPLNGTLKYASLRSRVSDAWAVFWCRAEAFRWSSSEKS